MEIDFDVNGVNAADFGCVSPLLQEEERVFHGAIFIPPTSSSSRSCCVARSQSFTMTDNRIGAVAQERGVSKGGGGGEVNGSYSWGGKEGGKVSGSASGECHDKHGNYAKVGVKFEGDQGDVKVSAGHKEE